MVKLIDPFALGFEVHSITSGNEAQVLCPFHDDHNPSATFNMAKGLFYCFACHESANLTQLQAVLDGVVVRTQAADALQGKAMREKREWEWLLSQPLAYDNEYLIGRHVTNGQVERHDIREFNDGVAFLLKDLGGRVVGAQIRYYRGKPKYDTLGTKPPLWPVENIKSHLIGEKLYVVEGVFSVLRLDRAGLSGVAVLGASSIHGAAQVLNGRSATVVFDDDFSGWLGAAKFMVTGMKVALPTLEVDETHPRQLLIFDRHLRYAKNINEIAEASGNPKKVARLVAKFRKAWTN